MASRANHVERHAPIRVLVAEDEEPLRAAICDLIAGEDGLELAAVASSADEAIEQAREVKPDVALLDVRMPGGGGPRAAMEIRSVSPDTRSIALSAYEDRSNVLEMLRAGRGRLPGEGRLAGRDRRRDSSSHARAGEPVGRDRRRARRRPLPRHHRAKRGRRGASSQRGAVPQPARVGPRRGRDHRRDGRIVLVNEQTERLFGYRREELIGQTIEMLLPRRFRDGHLRLRAGYFSNPSTRPIGAGLELAGPAQGRERVPGRHLAVGDRDRGRTAGDRVHSRRHRAKSDRDGAAKDRGALREPARVGARRRRDRRCRRTDRARQQADREALRLRPRRAARRADRDPAARALPQPPHRPPRRLSRRSTDTADGRRPRARRPAQGRKRVPGRHLALRDRDRRRPAGGRLRPRRHRARGAGRPGARDRRAAGRARAPRLGRRGGTAADRR